MGRAGAPAAAAAATTSSSLSPVPSWYLKLKSSKKDDKPTSDSDSLPSAAALVESHLKERPPWDQEFSSMSSCRSDLGKVVREDFEDEESELPPLLRNPHIAEFDVVDSWSGSEEEEEEELEEQYEEQEEEEGKLKVARKQRSDNSFSASLPSEIKGIVSDSIPLVKYSHNPYRDFSDSMLEMIREKELRCWSDLEELLFCYLSLNSPEHHPVIKQSFWDVWHRLSSSSSTSSSSTATR